MIAGDAFAKKAQMKVLVELRPTGRDAHLHDGPGCNENDLLHMNVNFPDCWDGRRLDSADHRSHMAYLANGNCPSTHKVSVPFMRMLILYPSMQRAPRSRREVLEHGDFISAWDQGRARRLVRRMNAPAI